MQDDAHCMQDGCARKPCAKQDVRKRVWDKRNSLHIMRDVRTIREGCHGDEMFFAGRWTFTKTYLQTGRKCVCVCVCV
jgi:hypothetical protein